MNNTVMTTKKSRTFSHPSGRESSVTWVERGGEPWWLHTWRDPEIDDGRKQVKYYPSAVVPTDDKQPGVRAHYDLVSAWLDSGVLS